MSGVWEWVRGVAKGASKDETLVSLLLPVLFAAQTFQDTIDQAHAFELSVVEIVAVFCLLIWILAKKRLEFPKSRSARFVLFLLGLWALVGLGLWVISGDWAYNLNEVRWLWIMLGAAIFVSYAAESGWERATKIFVGITLLSALVADFQGWTAAFMPPFASLPPKDFFLAPTRFGARSLAVGFYQHPNVFGAQVFWPLLICLGLAFKRKYRWLGILGAVFFGASLYLSYYRTMLVGFVFAAVLLGMVLLRVRPWIFAVATGVMSAVGMVVSVALGFLVNVGPFLGDVSGRAEYWVDALHFIKAQPVILLFGSGFQPSAALMQAQARSDPHDVYLYMLMHYGIIGLVLLIVLIAIIVAVGWSAYRSGRLKQEPVLGAIWVGFIAWFVTGTVDSRLTTAEWQVLFVTVVFLFLGGLFSQAKQGKVSASDQRMARIPDNV
jgi:O-antigen ligase